MRNKQNKNENGRLLPIDEENTQLFSSDVYKKGYTSEKMTSRLPYSGRSMIEMLGVLAIIGVLSVGGIAGYSKAMHRYRLNKAIEQITYAAGAVRAFFAPQKSYAGLENCTNGGGSGCILQRKAKLFPDDMWDETVELYGGAVIAKMHIGVYGYPVYAYKTGKAKSGDDLAFRIAYFIGHTNESIESCIDLITHDWSSAGVGAIELQGPGPIYLLKTPVTIDVAVNQCESIVRVVQNLGYASAEFPVVIFYFDIDLNGDYWKNKTFAN